MMPEQSAVPMKYAPLHDYLVAFPGTRLTLRLREIEAILGSPLPLVAWAQNWWNSVHVPSERTDGGMGHAQAWLHAGWRVAGAAFRTAEPAVTFVRSGTTSA